jgi:8-oxo-dGTP pyrophosphatase MutT (NUDIX family)
VGETEVFSGWIISVAQVDLVDPEGNAFSRDIVHHPGAVAIVAVDDDRQVTLVRQFRTAAGRAILEIPAGTRDVTGETPEVTARRELAEEAGLAAGEVTLLVSTYNSPGFSDQLTLIYLATKLSPCATDRVGVEERWMTLERVALDDVEALVSSGQLVDETTILGLLLARQALGHASS